MADDDESEPEAPASVLYPDYVLPGDYSNGFRVSSTEYDVTIDFMVNSGYPESGTYNEVVRRIRIPIGRAWDLTYAIAGVIEIEDSPSGGTTQPPTDGQ